MPRKPARPRSLVKWPPPEANGHVWKKAQAHLSRADPRLARIIDLVGTCTLCPRGGYFISLCQSIISQQISTVVARVIFRRFRNLFAHRRPTPDRLRLLDVQSLRSVGLSRQKIDYLQSLAAAFAENKVPVHRLRFMSDEEVIQALIPIRGIGRWTAEMFLIFVLNRTDLLPVDDLGLRKNAQNAYGLKKEPSAQVLIDLAECWRPYRSVATWYLWQLGNLKLR